MAEQSNAETAGIQKTTPRKGSRLTNTGIVLLVLGLVSPMPLVGLARGMGDGSGRLTILQRILLFSSDGFRLLFFLGIILLILGLLRRRRPS